VAAANSWSADSGVVAEVESRCLAGDDEDGTVRLDDDDVGRSTARS
jgi:hypothetical protein